MNKYDEVCKILKQYHQEHLLSRYDTLDGTKKEELLNQILEIDFEQMQNLYENIKNESNMPEDKISSIPYYDKEDLKENPIYFQKGAEAIRNGKLAVVTMAGGQGTRLGHKGPKGTFMLGINPDKSLFELLCDDLKKAKAKYDVYVPWYIMTSRENHNDTVEFFEKNNYFNYPKEDIKFFKQGELPMLDTAGNVILNEDGLVKLAADGHGGVFEAMFKNHIVEDMQKRHIEWVFVGPVDNPLAKMADEIFIGLAIEKNALEAGKSLIKANAKEKVGVFCNRNGKPSVIEYSEISEEMAEAVDGNGELIFKESHINCNMFNIKGIEQIGSDKLPYHTAFKKACYINIEGQLVTSDKPNCYKFESFIFDAFQKLDNMAVLRVKREDEFAPVKNAEGADSPEVTRKMYLDFSRRENQ